MSRSGVYYAIKAMDRTIAGAAASDAPGAPARRTADREALAPARSTGHISARARQVLARVLNGSTTRRAGRGRRSLRDAAGAD